MASKTTQLKINKMGWSVWSENPDQFVLNLGGQIERIFQGKRNVSIVIIQNLATSLEVEISEFFKLFDNE
jgi:transcriptional regulator with XRE-family HTH domain